MARDADLYVVETRSRFDRPRNTKRWYRCRCGRWWGVNKSCFCHCGAFPQRSVRRGATAAEQLAEDRRKVKILETLGHPEWAALVRGFIT